MFNLHTFASKFTCEQDCINHLENLRWGTSPACTSCGSLNPYKLKGGKNYKCRECKKFFNVLTGTFFENTKIPLLKWFKAILIFTSHKKGISSIQLGKDLGISQHSSWFVLSRLRELLREKGSFMLTGMVEADESYLGGKVSNKHAKVRKDIKNKMSPLIKTPVLGLLQRNGKVFTQVVKDVNRLTVIPIVKSLLSSDAILVTDSSHMYTPIKDTHEHHVINHEQGEYVRGFVHTNGIEGYWSHLKRGIYGIYHQVSPKHLHRYCDEYSFRYNTRKCSEVERFDEALKQSEGSRLKYADLTKKVSGA